MKIAIQDRMGSKNAARIKRKEAVSKRTEADKTKNIRLHSTQKSKKTGTFPPHESHTPNGDRQGLYV